jgi:hypothetical protein
VSVSASRPSQHPVAVLSYFDVLLIVVAAPIMLLIGVSATGYLAGAGAWIVLRLVGIGVERFAASSTDARAQISVRMGYMMGRLFTLALTVILARQSSQGAGLAALAVVVCAFTIQLGMSAVTRPRSR